MMILRRVGVLSCGKLLGCLYALLGFLIGGVFSLLAVAGFAFGGGRQGPGELVFGVGAIVLLPVFYGVLGFIAGIIGAGLYNLIAGVVGGIELELVPNRPEQYQQDM